MHAPPAAGAAAGLARRRLLRRLARLLRVDVLRAVRPRPARRPTGLRRSWSTWRCLAVSPCTTACWRAAARSGGSRVACRLIWSAPSTSGSPACSSSRCARGGGMCRARSIVMRVLGRCRTGSPSLLGAWLTARSAAGHRPARPGRDSTGGRRLGAASLSRGRPLSLGSSPDLSRLVADGLRRASHDRDPSRVCGDQFGLPRRRDPV